MELLPRAFARALSDMLLPGMLKIFLLCLLAYGIGLITLSLAAGYALGAFSGMGGVEGFFLKALGALGGWLIAWFLFPLLYPVLISFFDDYAADVIEHEDYPHLVKATPPFWPSFRQDVVFTLKAIGLNIVFLPVYVLFLPLAPLFYYALNGYLLGSQFFRMSAGRRISYAEAGELQRKYRGAILVAGIGIAFCATIPLLNLAAPLLGVATMLHLFHLIKGNDRQTLLAP